MYNNCLMKSVLSFAVASLLGLTSSTSAQVTFEWVPIAHPGNVGRNGGAEFLSVGYPFSMAKYEVTNNQYAEFLNAVAATEANNLFSTSMESDPIGGITRSGLDGNYFYEVKTDMGDKPVNYVTKGDAKRFVNWMQNGQPTGPQDSDSTEAGVYTDPDNANNRRTSGATFFLPTKDEWNKAAHFDPRSSAEGGPPETDPLGLPRFWWFTTQSSLALGEPLPASATVDGDVSNPGPHVENCGTDSGWNGQATNLTTVGAAGGESYYGVSDMGGNVSEHLEGIRFIGNYFGSPCDRSNLDYIGLVWLSAGSNRSEGGFRVARLFLPDFNGDGDVDLRDFRVFQLSHSGPK